MPRRKHAFDTVRFIALIGILINHTLSLSSAKPLVNVLQDYHAVLFVLLMGVFIDINSSVKKTLIRTGVLIGAGFALGSADITLDVILINLGLLNLIVWTIAKTFTKIKTLLVITLSWLILSPVVSQFSHYIIEHHLGIVPRQYNTGAYLLFNEPLYFFLRPIFYSSYPVLQWTTIVLFGIILKHFINAKWWKISIIGLTMFSLAKTSSFLLGGSLWTMDNGTANNWGNIFDSGAYTGTSLGILSSVGMGYLIIGIVVFLDNILKWRINPYLSGSTLSLYSIHVFSFTFIPISILENTTYAFILFAATLFGFVIISYLWYLLSKKYGFIKYGPLEEFTYYLTLPKENYRAEFKKISN